MKNSYKENGRKELSKSEKLKFKKDIGQNYEAFSGFKYNLKI